MPSCRPSLDATPQVLLRIRMSRGDRPRPRLPSTAPHPLAAQRTDACLALAPVRAHACPRLVSPR
eukprot:2730721-Prymnesium_polylepis.1